MSLDPDDISSMIEDCQDREEKMSEWEIKFIDDIDNQLGHGESLTPKQEKKLEQIWDRITE